MNTYFVRFVGDPTGYRVLLPADFPDDKYDAIKPLWVIAHVGHTDREVRIDVSQAYVVEPYEKP